MNLHLKSPQTLISKLMIVILCMSFLFTSCGKKRPLEGIAFNAFAGNETLQFTNVTEYGKGNPSRIRMMNDSVLVILNRKLNATHYVYTYSLNNNQFSKGLLDKGRGPGEALGARAINIIGDQIVIYDITLKKMLSIPVAKVIDSTERPVFQEVKIEKFYDHVSFLNNNSFLATGLDGSENKISLVNLNDESVQKSFGSYDYKPSNVPIDAYKDAFTSYLLAKPSGDKFVAPYRYTDRIEIYDIKGDTIIEKQGPEIFDPVYETKERNGFYYMAKTKKTRKAFVNGAVTDNYIYLLYSGHYRVEENWSHGKTLYVFDWEGNPVKQIDLDRYIYTFAVSSDDKDLYSFDEDTGFIVHANLSTPQKL